MPLVEGSAGRSNHTGTVGSQDTREPYRPSRGGGGVQIKIKTEDMVLEQEWVD